MRMRMGRILALASLAAVMAAAGCASSTETIDARALEGTWDSPFGGEREAIIFEGVGDAGEIEGLPSAYEHYRFVDGALVMVQSGRYHIEVRDLTLVNRHQVPVLVRTVTWDQDSVAEGTRLEQAVIGYDGAQFELTGVGLAGAGRLFYAVDSL